MRTVPAALVPPRPTSALAASPMALVCAALTLALAFLAFQIADVLVAFPDCSLIGDSVDGTCPIPEIRAGHLLP